MTLNCRVSLLTLVWHEEIVTGIGGYALHASLYGNGRLRVHAGIGLPH